VATVLLVAAFLVPTADDRYLVPALPVAGALVAWGLRHAPRVGAALAVATLALSAYETLTR
jgi:hypothetical protein